VFLILENLNEIGVTLKGILKLMLNEMFPFLSNHMWYGFREAQDLVDFLEDGAYADDVIIDEEDIKAILAEDAKKNRVISGKTFGNGKDEQSLLPMVLPKKKDTKKETVIVEKPKGPQTQSTQVIIEKIDDETIEIITVDKAHGVSGG
jgi:hypothetical protein